MAIETKKSKKYFVELCDQFELNKKIVNSLLEKSPSLRSCNGLKDAVNETSTRLFSIAFEEYMANVRLYSAVMRDISETEKILSEIEQKFGPSAKTLIESLYIKKMPVNEVSKKMEISTRTIRNRVTRYLAAVLK